MPANTVPIFTDRPDLSVNNSTTLGAPLTTATGDYTGVSANHVLEHTAGANGSYVRRLQFTAMGSNVASVARVYINNGSDPTVAANNAMFDQISLPATTAINTAATATVTLPIEIALPAGFRIYVGLGTSVTGWDCVCVAGQY